MSKRKKKPKAFKRAGAVPDQSGKRVKQENETVEKFDAGKSRNSKIKPALIVLGLAITGIIGLFIYSRFSGRKVVNPAGLKNVLLITLDTTRADRLGSYGYSSAMTPSLDSLARRGIRFESAYCQVPLTLPSHASILTGLNPCRHGVRNNGNYVLADDFLTIAEVFKSKGFKTAAFVASFSVDSRFGLAQGFDYYDDSFETGSPFKPLNSEKKANEVFASFARWFEKNHDSRFFAWVHFFDPHFPYAPPPEYMREFAESPYDGEVAFMDKYVGETIRLLEGKNLLDSTLIVVAGDHGEAFGEKVEEGHGLFLYEMSVRVPMIISAPGNLPVNRVEKSVVSLIDIFPTVLDCFSIEPVPEVDGKSLLSLLSSRRPKNRDVYLETFYPRENYSWSELVGLVSDGWKYIQAPKPELYNLIEDPEEKLNLVELQPKKTQDFQSRLERLLVSSTGIKSNARELSSIERERLRSLGYVQFAGQSGSGQYPDPKDKLEDLKLFQTAVKLEAARDFASVEHVYQELLPRYPDVPTIYVNLALAQARQMKLNQAIETLKKGTEVIPDSDILLSRLGHTYVVMNRTADALEAMQKALAVNPECFDALVVSAVILESWSRMEDARRMFVRALKVEPENEFLRSSYARNLAMSGLLNEAITAYLELIKDFPNVPVYYENLGIAYYLTKDNDRAIEYLTKSISLKPSPKSYRYLASAYGGKGLIDKEIEALEGFLRSPGQEATSVIDEVRAELKRLKTMKK